MGWGQSRRRRHILKELKIGSSIRIEGHRIHIQRKLPTGW